MKKKYDFAIKGAYGGSNFGDDLLMIYIISMITKVKPRSSICVITNRDDKYVENYNLSVDFIYPSNEININASHLIVGGGTQYVEFHKKTIDKFKDKFMKIFSIKKILKKLKRKYLLDFNSCSAISLGIGPFYNQNSKSYISAINNLNKCEFLSIRDQASEAFCKENGIKHLKHTDICFNLDTLNYRYTSNTNDKVKKIGIIVRDWIYDDNGDLYILTLLRLSKKLKREGYQVDFITFTSISDSHVTTILKNANENIIIYNPDIYGIEEFINLLSQYSLFVSARAHGAIVATYLGIPTILIEIEPKLKNIEIEITNGRLLWSPYIDSDLKLFNLVDSVISNYNYWKDITFKARAKNKELANILIDDYTNYLKGLR